MISTNGLLVRYIRIFYFVLLDAIALIAARYIAEAINVPWNLSQNFSSSTMLIIGIHFSIFLTKGLYQSGRNRRNYPAIFNAVSISNLIILLVTFLYFPNAVVSHSAFLIFCALSFFLVSLGRYLSNLIILELNKHDFFLHPTFVITDPQHASKIIDLIQTCFYCKFCGWDDMEALSTKNIDHTIRRLNILGVQEVYIHSDSLQDAMHIYWKLQHAGVTLYLLPQDLSPIFREVELSYLHGIPCFQLNVPSITGFNFRLKRSLDFLGAITLLTLLSPIYLLLSILIYLDNPGPIFYRQLRVGLHDRPFKVWKFRTMVTNADQLQKALESRNENEDGILFKLKDDPRITRFGNFLRCYSLDELPQIFNILLGEMSFIGPRPLPLRDVEKFSEHHHIRHEVLPGITGLWQISGRSDILNFDDVLKLDVQYIEQWSIWLDLKILLKTVFVVLSKSGAY
jgi:exopolysaccharide biosynthesis polyprenyl glycosylphosphotransferase